MNFTAFPKMRKAGIIAVTITRDLETELLTKERAHMPVSWAGDGVVLSLHGRDVAGVQISVQGKEPLK